MSFKTYIQTLKEGAYHSSDLEKAATFASKDLSTDEIGHHSMKVVKKSNGNILLKSTAGHGYTVNVDGTLNDIGKNDPRVKNKIEKNIQEFLKRKVKK
jgi:hypothetical protein